MSNMSVEEDSYYIWSADDSEPGHLKKCVISAKKSDDCAGKSRLNCVIVFRGDHIHFGAWQRRGKGYSIFRSGIKWDEIIANLSLEEILEIRKRCVAVIEAYAMKNGTFATDVEQSSGGE